MDEQIKRFFFTGISLVSLTLECLRDTIEELIKSNKISEEEGQRIISDFLALTRPKRDELEKQLHQLIHRPRQAPSSHYQEEILQLRNRISELEMRLSGERSPLSGRFSSFRQRQERIPLVQKPADTGEDMQKTENKPDEPKSQLPADRKPSERPEDEKRKTNSGNPKHREL